MTKEQIIAAILACKEKLGRIPSSTEAVKHGRVNTRALYRHFKTYGHALAACGLPPSRIIKAADPAELFKDWVRVARKLQKIPTRAEYNILGHHTHRPLERLLGWWKNVPAGMKRYAKKNGLEKQWKDVLDIATKRQRDRKKAQARILKDRPTYGRLMLM